MSDLTLDMLCEMPRSELVNEVLRLLAEKERLRAELAEARKDTERAWIDVDRVRAKVAFAMTQPGGLQHAITCNRLRPRCNCGLNDLVISLSRELGPVPIKSGNEEGG